MMGGTSRTSLCMLVVCCCGVCSGFRVLETKGESLPAWHPHRKPGHGHSHRETSKPSRCSWSEDLLSRDANVAELFKGVLGVCRCNTLSRLGICTTATVKHSTWAESSAVRREFQAFADMCSTKTEFAAALNRYLAVYKHALDPSIPPQEKRILPDKNPLSGLHAGAERLRLARLDGAGDQGCTCAVRRGTWHSISLLRKLAALGHGPGSGGVLLLLPGAWGGPPVVGVRPEGHVQHQTGGLRRGGLLLRPRGLLHAPGRGGLEVDTGEKEAGKLLLVSKVLKLPSLQPMIPDLVVARTRLSNRGSGGCVEGVWR
eukprot:1191170-Prorocentrum_minimum.AAC.1